MLMSVFYDLKVIQFFLFAEIQLTAYVRIQI